MKQPLTTILLIALPASCLAQAQFIPLGDLPGGSHYSVIAGFNTDASRIVAQFSARSFWGEAVLWDADGMHALGYIQNQSEAAAVSNSGHRIAGSTDTPEGWQAFVWSQDAGMVGIGDLPGGEFLSSTRDMSADGRVVVGYSAGGAAGPGLNEAFRWSDAGGMVGLGFLGGDDDRKRSYASAISADGTVIVGGASSDYNNNALGFRWTEQTGMVALADLPGGRISGGAQEVSDDGRWIVGSSGSENFDGTFRNEAVLWHPDGTAQGLGILDHGLEIRGNSSATSVSNDGRIVTGTYGNELDFGYFFWTPEEGMRPLEEVLLTDYGLDLAAMGWYNISGLISGDGNSIIGVGSNSNAGGTEAFLIRLVPAPATLAPLAAAGLLAARRRR